jgi:hypothetical protein
MPPALLLSSGDVLVPRTAPAGTALTSAQDLLADLESMTLLDGSMSFVPSTTGMHAVMASSSTQQLDLGNEAFSSGENINRDNIFSIATSGDILLSRAAESGQQLAAGAAGQGPTSLGASGLSAQAEYLDFGPRRPGPTRLGNHDARVSRPLGP